jgi:hypothetical protein
VISSVHGTECPPARKGGLGAGVGRRKECRDLRVEHARVFLRVREIKRESVCACVCMCVCVVHLCICVINAKSGTRRNVNGTAGSTKHCEDWIQNIRKRASLSGRCITWSVTLSTAQDVTQKNRRNRGWKINYRYFHPVPTAIGKRLSRAACGTWRLALNKLKE